MSIFRSAALCLPASAAVSRAALAPRAGAVRFASAVANQPTSEALKAFEELRIKDPRIPEGVKAYGLLVPEDLPPTDFNKRRAAVEAHSVETTNLWRRISFYVCIPAILVAAIYVYQLEAEHEEHLQHIIDENGGVPPERKTYSYMNMRTKQFPWGKDSLFFNPRYNIPVAEE
ncbi:cytochrome c oxidase subunit VIa-domain-containing protein [Papiliotrema laurentii]|uniref:Cytochrome c oxidase subunit VIa-domain-containing protein n=1 Tax=Papiliotrema laurentii TaxID=5418 RepID=A0AAD9FX86_PAPLA|nr:cytochrome c oxidase subunit VIa-domain-containing protein [Papiliotrema laurentii]